MAVRSLFTVLIALVLVWPLGPQAAVVAQAACLPDQEPNDTPEAAAQVAGELCLEGTLTSGDQDLLIWEVPEGAPAATLWSIELLGVGGTLTTLRLLTITSPPGVEPIVANDLILTLDAPPESRQPVKRDALLVPAGRHLIGVSRTDLPGGGAPPDLGYRLAIRSAGTLPGNADVEPNDSIDLGSPAEADFALSGDLLGGADYYAWTVPPADDGMRWWVDLQGVLGTSMGLALHAPDGRTLATARTDALGVAPLVDLVLTPGEYRLAVSGSVDRPTPYALAASQAPAVGDAEPNDGMAPALPYDPSLAPTASGRIFPEGDVDRYRFTIPTDDPGLLRDIKVFSPDPDAYRRVCLELADGTDLQCREGRAAIILRSLLLPPGEYDLSVGGDADEATPYVLRIDETEPVVADFEVEPNDGPATATAFTPGISMRGLGGPGDEDTFRLTVTDEPELWEVRASGDALTALSWVKADGRTLARNDTTGGDGGEIVLTDVLLTPGEHWFKVASEGSYRIDVRPLGPPHPDGEREPNDGAAYAQPYPLSRSRVIGRLPSIHDLDVFRFSLAAPEHLILHVDPPADAAIDLSLESSGMRIGQRRSNGPGIATSYAVALQAGDYEVWLRTLTPSEERYTFSIERGDPFSLPADREPNDAREAAAPLPPTLQVDGSGPASGDVDWYELPPAADGSVVTVAVTGAVSDVRLESEMGFVPGSHDRASGTYTSEPVAGGGSLALSITATGDYSADVSITGVTPTQPPGALPLELKLEASETEVAAYWPTGQRIDAQLTLENTSAESLSVDLDAVTSHFAWRAELEAATLEVPALGSVSTPILIAIGPDAWADEPVRISARARADDGAQVTTSLDVIPRREAVPVAPHRVWPVPDALLGGLDVASPGLGAVTLPSVDPLMEDELHDGLAHVGTGFVTDEARLPLSLDVDLAGEEAVPVAGMIIDPQAADAHPGNVPRSIELLLSVDGVTYESVLTAEATTLMRDQAFVLPEPVPATHARLRIHSTWPGGTARVALGEWKVIAVPGSLPANEAIDVAAPARGGHVSWLDPQQVDAAILESMLTPDLTPTLVYPEPGAAVAWAVAFRDDRAALVERIEWIDPQPSDPALRLQEVEVSGSLEGPAGPWLSLGTWPLERATDGSIPAFELDEPGWFRALRFSARARQDGASQTELPGSLRVIEHATGDGYRSVVAEWGAANPEGPYEWLQQPEGFDAEAADDEDDEPLSATSLEPGQQVRGWLPDGEDVDWYAFDVPADHNTVTIDATGQPILVAALTLHDAEGFEVPLLFEPGSEPGSVRYLAEIDPGATYRLRVERPPSSIVFTFDTSGSMGPYLDYVYQAMRAFTSDVRPGEEAIRIVPFEEEPLLDDWSDERYALQNAVDQYVLGGGSSSAETALIDASTELSAREGAQAILIVTDAETSSYLRSLELWHMLAATRPLIVTVHVGATLYPFTTRSMMQDWAAVAGGMYQYTRSHGEMDRAFDRLATWLRRPAGYGLTLETAFREEPPPSRTPGSLVVSSHPEGQLALAPTVGVEIILDTSGSMLRKLGRQRRIDVARDAMRDLVGEHLPAGTNVALRTFGDGAGTCDTQLAVPLAPLDRVAMAEVIDDLVIERQTKTPIGAALAEVPGDLGSVEGTKIVLLITDGAETCEGDPAQAVRDLRRRGIDARLNLVGFALQDRKAKRAMRAWSRQGNGSYFDARNSAQLGRAVRRAISAPFRILDEAGNEVASGTVDGQPVPLDPGTYSIVVLTQPTVRFDAVIVDPDEAVSLTMPPPEVPLEEPEAAAAG